MNCQHCNSSNEPEAIFCSYCGQQVSKKQEAPAEPEVVPALGSTIDLSRFRQPARPAILQPALATAQAIPAALSRPLSPAHAPTSSTSGQRHRRRSRGRYWNAVIGIGFLLLITGVSVFKFIVPLLITGLGWIIYQGHIPRMLRPLIWLAGLVAVVLFCIILIKTLFFIGALILPAIFLIWLGIKLIR